LEKRFQVLECDDCQAAHSGLGDVSTQNDNLKVIISEAIREWTASKMIKGGEGGLTTFEVNSMIEMALEKYSADKLGLPDFALRRAGASIIHRDDLTSPTYTDKLTTMDKMMQGLGLRSAA
jgi:hypothetical protein